MGDDFIPTERELWNTAKIYSISHIAEPLIRCRKLVTICLFGVEEIGQESSVNPSMLNQNRIIAIERLLQELKLLCITNIGFMKKKSRKDLLLLTDRLEKVEQVISGVSHITTDQRTGQSQDSINKDHFNTCIRELQKIYAETINALADLIFPSGDELDLDKVKQSIIEEG